MGNSYRNILSNKAGAYCSFEKDFGDIGDFETEEIDGEIILSHTCYPGYFNGEKWIEASCPNEDLYSFYIEYKSQERVLIMLTSEQRYASTNILIPTYLHILYACEKFFLVNNLVSHAQTCENVKINFKWIKALIDPPTWEDVVQLIEYANEVNQMQPNPIDTNSCKKYMTVDEAIDLFDYLKVKIVFPH